MLRWKLEKCVVESFIRLYGADLTVILQQVYVKVTSSHAGTYRISAISFLFHGLLPCIQSLERKGKRLFTTKQERLEPTYAQDDSLVVTVGQPKPNIQLDFDLVPTVMIHGELRQVDITMTNTGSMAVRDVKMLSSIGGFLSPVGNEGSRGTCECNLPDKHSHGPAHLLLTASSKCPCDPQTIDDRPT